MTPEHPITQPDGLVERLRSEAPHGIRDAGVSRERHLAIAAYRAGADAELEACCEWLDNTCCDFWDETAAELRAARRPKPPILAEQALAEINLIEGAMYGADLGCDFTATRAALERLQELEQGNG